LSRIFQLLILFNGFRILSDELQLINMDLTEKNGVPVFIFPELAHFPNVRHGIFTRRGGCSKPPFNTLNVSLSVGDDISDVESNRAILSELLEANNMLFLNQVHGDNIITLSNRSDFDINSKHPFTGDAAITDIKKMFLVIQTADCQSILIYDPVRQVVANIHSGWKGSIKNIAGNTIKKMTQSFGCRPSDAIVCISPSLCKYCSEFINYKKEFPQKYWKYKNMRNYFNFWSISTDQLVAEGVLPKNIFLSNLCTKCNSNFFFSYRKEHITGRFASVIGII